MAIQLWNKSGGGGSTTPKPKAGVQLWSSESTPTSSFASGLSSFAGGSAKSLAAAIDKQKQQKQAEADAQAKAAKQSAWQKVGNVLSAPGRAIANVAYKPLEKEQNRAADLGVQQTMMGLPNTAPSEAAQTTKEANILGGVGQKAKGLVAGAVSSATGGLKDVNKEVIQPATKQVKQLPNLVSHPTEIIKSMSQKDQQLKDFKQAEATGKISKATAQAATVGQKQQDVVRMLTEGKSDKQIQDFILNKRQATQDTENRIGAEIAGTAAMLYGGGEAKGALTGLKPLLSNAVKNTATGAVINEANTIQNNPNASTQEKVKSAVTGGLFGLGTGVATHAIGAVGERAHPNLTPELTSTFNQTADKVAGRMSLGEKALGSVEDNVKPLLEEGQMIKKAQEVAPGDARLAAAASQNNEKVAQATQPVETPQPLKPIGEGETKTSKLAASVEQKAVDKKLTEKLGSLPEYKQVNMKDQARFATDLLVKDEQSAIRIARGEEAPPAHILPESVFTAVEDKALRDNNIDLIRQLATSSRTSEATAMGQRIRALADRSPDSVTGAIKQVIDARKAAVERKYGSVDKAINATANEIKAHVKPTSRMDWGQFVESLKC